MKRVLSSIPTEHVIGSVFIYLTVILGRLYAIPAGEASAIWPAIGVAMALVFFYGKRIVPAVWIGYALGYATSYAIAGMDGVLTYTLLPVLMGFTGLAPVCLGRHLAQVTRFKPVMRLKNIGRFFLFAPSIALLAAALGHAVYVVFGVIEFDFSASFVPWVVGDFFSLIIIGVPLLFALHYDPHPLPTKFTKAEIALYVSFFLVTMVLISGVLPFFSYTQHSYIYSIFAIVVGLHFPYRTAYMFSLILMSLLLFVQPLFVVFDAQDVVFDINVFFSLMTIIVLILKEYSRVIERARETNIQKSRRLDNLITAMQRLLSFSAAFRNVDERKIDRLAEEMFDTVLALFPKNDYGSLALVGKRIKFIACKGYDLDTLNALQFPSEKWSYDLHEPYHEKDPMARAIGDPLNPSLVCSLPRLKESIFVSVRMTEHVICTMAFDLDQASPLSYNDDDLAFFTSLQILFNSFYEAESLSSAGDHLRTSILRALLRTLETFDAGMRNHHLAVAKTAETIAVAAHVDAAVAEEIYWAGIVHDIGKLGVEESVVKKKGAYTVDDFEKMKAHPALGHQVLIQSKELQAIAQYVREHHERLDGSGYPDGLRGTEISIGGQIVGLAEVIVSMAHGQPYRAPSSREAIVDELKRLRDVHFDKHLIDIAIDHVESKPMPWLQKNR